MRDHYDRELLVKVLIYHRPNPTNSCVCGWSELGELHAAHVADVYESAIGLIKE